MAALPHQLVTPSHACRRRGHRIEQRAKATGSGVWDYCWLCSLAYERAMHAGLTEHEADRFVQSIRR